MCTSVKEELKSAKNAFQLSSCKGWDASGTYRKKFKEKAVLLKKK